jgi:hypothetical protein
VRFKGHGDRFEFLFLGALHDSAEDFGVRSMHPIEVTHSDDGGPKIRWKVIKFVENLHACLG